MLIPNTKATLGKAADSKVDTRLALAYGSLFPVSYTHLDVYKRQVKYSPRLTSSSVV